MSSENNIKRFTKLIDSGKFKIVNFSGKVAVLTNKNIWVNEDGNLINIPILWDRLDESRGVYSIAFHDGTISNTWETLHYASGGSRRPSHKTKEEAITCAINEAWFYWRYPNSNCSDYGEWLSNIES